MKDFKKYVYNRHDTYCNQKYAGKHYYSVHIDSVFEQGRKFFHLLEDSERDVVDYALLGHDLLEDARLTYNDLLDVVAECSDSAIFAKEVADIVYAITDEKGKSRTERKNEKYYKELSENKLAVFVKLADISANTLYSKLNGSTMYQRYKSEFGKFKEKCFTENYADFFKYLENL